MLANCESVESNFSEQSLIESSLEDPNSLCQISLKKNSEEISGPASQLAPSTRTSLATIESKASKGRASKQNERL